MIWFDPERDPERVVIPKIFFFFFEIHEETNKFICQFCDDLINFCNGEFDPGSE